MKLPQFVDEDDDTASAILSLVLWSSLFLALYTVTIGDLNIDLYLFVVLVIVVAVVIVVISEIRDR